MATLSDVQGEPLVDGCPSIWEGFETHVHATPDALAVAAVHQPPGLFGAANIELDEENYRRSPYLRWSFRIFHDGILQLCEALRARGVKEGDTVVTFVHNGAEYSLIAMAAVRMGCNFMPISIRNLTNTEEVVHMTKTGLQAAQDPSLVVFAQDKKVAFAVDQLGTYAGALKFVLESQPSCSEWTPFESLMDGQQSPVDLVNIPPPSDKGGSILFTSGTTSLPKAVFHPYSACFVVPIIRSSSEGAGSWGPGKKLCGSMPNNHGMGYSVAIAMHMSGTAMIYTGLAFEPALLLDTLYGESATHAVLVPTMIFSLAAVKAASPKYSSRPLSCVENIMLGGSSCTTEHGRLLLEELGVQAFENLYGCTEGVIVTSRRTTDFSKIARGNDISTGWPAPSYRIRLIDPDTGKIVPRNTLGEIHGAGLCVKGPYVGGVGLDSWYDDEDGTRWYKTGDQGLIDDQGRLFVSGRYKDMIIRGGENISPAAIEALLAKHPLLSSLDLQIVGAKDAIAGEVPLAVIKGRVTPEIRAAIQSEVLQHMGALYLPQDVISNEDLGLDDYPRTLSRKVQKIKLAALANEFLSKGEGQATNGQAKSNHQLAEEIRGIWAKAVGLEPQHIRMDAPVWEFADSITVMRVRERIRKHTGKTLPLAAMTNAGTIDKQVELLQTIGGGPAGSQVAPVKRIAHRGPPTAEDMAHLAADPDLFEPTKKLVTETIGKYGLGWGDVEDVMPTYDFNAIMSQTRLYDSWKINLAVQPTRAMTKTQLRAAYEAVIANNRIMGSFLVWDADALGTEDALHVVIKQTDKLFDVIIQDGGELETIADLDKTLANTSQHNQVSFDGPMSRTILYDIKETGGAAMIVFANHAVIDASFAQIIQEDLDRALAVVTGDSTTADILAQLHPHTDYKPWADSHYNLRTSIEARASTKWHLRRLKDLAEHVEAGALFPSKPYASPKEKAAQPMGAAPVPFAFDVPAIHKLRQEYPHITATVVVKAAMALMNIHRTGHTHAVFGNLEAARTYFPFLPKAVLDYTSESHQFEASDVSGPCFQMVFNVVKVGDGGRETVLQFLERMQQDQTALTKHAAAPLREIMRGLDKASPGAGQLISRVIDTQHFNWVPGLGTMGTDPLQHLRMTSQVSGPTTGLCVHAGLGGKENQTIFLNVFGDNIVLDRDEAGRVGQQIEAITKWLLTSENWTSLIGGYTESVSTL